MSNNLESLRHSTSHVMAQAVMRLFKNVKLGIGPSIEDGFYYDFDINNKIIEDDLIHISKEMENILKEKQNFVRESISKEEALEIFKNQPYKIDLINNLPDDEISIYKNGEFVDLCKGPHVNNTKAIKHFKLTKIAGAYWHGDEKNQMLTRVYGTVFESKNDLDAHLDRIEEAKKRDHRILGKKLELFSIHDEVGAGLIHWHPKGTIIKKLIEDRWTKEHINNGYKLVVTPHIASEEIYKISGHLQNYSDLMYSSMNIENQPFRVKPMNCPGHIMIYKSKIHSYRELPIRYAELGTVYRFEKSGVLHGLLRVRGFTIDDAHIICAEDQIEDEVHSVLNLCFKFLALFGFKDFKIYLSTKPSDKYVGSDKDWEKAENSLKNTLKELNYDYELDKGGGAFYGPKIDIKVKDSLNREWQCSTVQFDFNLPTRFDMSYHSSDGIKRPYMIHRAILGSIERFLGILIEHYAGEFPLWLAPLQVLVIPIAEKNMKTAETVCTKLKNKNVRVEIDIRDEKLGKRIWLARDMKIPYTIIIGDKETENNISVRNLKGDQSQKTIDEFIEDLNNIGLEGPSLL